MPTDDKEFAGRPALPSMQELAGTGILLGSTLQYLVESLARSLGVWSIFRDCPEGPPETSCPANSRVDSRRVNIWGIGDSCGPSKI